MDNMKEVKPFYLLWDMITRYVFQQYGTLEVEVTLQLIKENKAIQCFFYTEFGAKLQIL